MLPHFKASRRSLNLLVAAVAIISTLFFGDLGLFSTSVPAVSAGPHSSRGSRPAHVESRDESGVSEQDRQALKDNQVIVEHVSDGDTLTVLYRGQRERVRLVGIDAPESSENEKAFRDAKRTESDVRSIISQGKKSAAYTQSLVRPGEILGIEFDVEKRDRYSRLLAYLYLPSGEMLNRKIVAEGYAYPYTRPPNVRYAEKLRKDFEQARKSRRGLWGQSPQR